MCPAKSKKCNKCGVIGHFDRVWRKPQKQQNGYKLPPQRVIWVDEEPLDDKEIEEEEQFVLGIDGSGSPPFMMRGKINRKKSHLKIDSCSPVTLINYEDHQKILQYETLFVRPLPEVEKYVDYNKRPVNLLRFCELEVGGKYIRKARILVAKSGAKSIFGSDWLNYLQYSIEPKKKGKLCNSINLVNSKTDKAIGKWTNEIELEFPELFEQEEE